MSGHIEHAKATEIVPVITQRGTIIGMDIVGQSALVLGYGDDVFVIEGSLASLLAMMGRLHTALASYFTVVGGG